MDTPPGFSNIFINFCDFLFASLDKETLLNKSTLIGRNLLKGEQLFFFSIDKGSKKPNLAELYSMKVYPSTISHPIICMGAIIHDNFVAKRVV